MNIAGTEAFDIIVVGASLGGVLAAHRAAESGCRVLLTREHAWLGGQMTAQGVPPDEHAHIESGGASASYLAFREAMRATYADDADFLNRDTLTKGLNPGDGWVSRLCFEPARAARWFEELLEPARLDGRLQVMPDARLISAHREGRRITRITLESRGAQRDYFARCFIDGTDTGALIKAAGLPYRLGKEARAEFGEPGAPESADPLDQQPVTWVIALRKEAHPAAPGVPPEAYDFWARRIVPHFAHRQFSGHLPGEGAGKSAWLPFFCEPSDSTRLDWWRYRRIVASHQWRRPRADVSLINWAQNDYALQPLLDGPLPQADVESAARELTACWVHWLRSEAPRHDGAGLGYPELVPDGALGTADGFAQQVYVRESRRIIGVETLSQGDIHALGDERTPARTAESAGIGWYNMDIHPTCRSGHGTNARVRPFEIPLGAWLPADCDNLLPACKNLSVTHLVSAVTRVHPIEWLAGEVAGVIAAEACLRAAAASRPAGRLSEPLAQWRTHPGLLGHLRERLALAGIPTHWPASIFTNVATVGP